MVSAMPPPLYPQERPGTHSIGGWVGFGPVWTGAENLAPNGFQIPDCSARSEIEIQFIVINLPTQKPDGQLKKQHNTETQITQENKQDTYQTSKTNNRILKSLITHYNS